MFEMLGRPPPLEPLEMLLFTEALSYHLRREFPDEDTGRHKPDEE